MKFEKQIVKEFKRKKRELIETNIYFLNEIDK